MEWHDPVGRLTDPAPAEFAKWTKPAVALGELITGVTQQLSDTLYARLRNGRLYAAAAGADWLESGERKSRGITAIDPSWWAYLGKPIPHHSALWLHGDIALHVPARGEAGAWLVEFSGVRFEYAGLDDVIGPLRKKFDPAKLDFSVPLGRAAPTAPLSSDLAGAIAGDSRLATSVSELLARSQEPSPTPWKDAEVAPVGRPSNPRGAGRPSLPYWEEAVLNVAQRMHLGEFKPATIADVSRALADWIVEHGHPEPGPTQLRSRAKMIFEMFKD